MTLAHTDLGSGPALVLLHAFPVNRQLWSGVAEILAGDDWRVVAPDLPGFGDSPRSAQPPGLAEMARAVFELLDTLGVSEFCLGGLSMGGYVAMEMLRQEPERARSLLLVDTKMSADAPAARDNRLAVADRAEAEGSTEFLVSAMIPALLGPMTLAHRQGVVERVSGWIRATDPLAVAWAQRAMADRPDSRATLAEFQRPALVVGGQDDAITPPAEQRELAAVLADSGLQLVPDVGHLSAVEDPGAVAGAVARHDDRLRAPLS